MKQKDNIIEPVVLRVDPNSPSIKWVEKISHWLDSRFLIPGTRIRFGIDPIASLFPVVGDLITFFISAALIYTMHTHGASRKVVIMMIMNSTLDAIIGAIPLVGTIFDIFYRANDRNLRLLKEHYFEGKHEGSENGLLLVIAIVAVLLVVGVVYAVYRIFEAIF